MQVKEVAALVGISIRTLHHYDAIGLLTPHTTTEAGYRIYSQEEINRLQHILFFKELGFSLQRIKEIMYDPEFDQEEALHHHRNMLLKKKTDVEQMIQTIDKTIAHLKGDIQMENKDKFAGFNFRNNPYEEEARERWGNEAVDTSNKKLSELDSKQIEEQMNGVFRKLAEVRHEDPASPIAQEEIDQWYTLLNTFGSYPPEAFMSLGEMYVADERFTKNIDQFGEGLALFMSKAMVAFADEQRAKENK